MREYLSSIQDVLNEQNTSKGGLNSFEAQARLEKNGPNKLDEGKKTPLIVRFLKELADPMIIILIVAAAISAITAFLEGGESFADVIIIMAVVLINAILGVFQESKAEKAIEALKEITAATSKVYRDGRLISIRSEDLVCGDIIVLEAGDAVPADARIIENASMKVEEAALTGESVPVEKSSDALDLGDKKDVPLGDRVNMLYMGSTVVYGRGLAVVTAVGMDTEMGKIANVLTQSKEDDTPLQIKLNQLSKILSFLVLGICAVIFGINLLRVYPNIESHVVLDTFLVAVSLAVAAIPEGLAAVVTIVLSIGVTNMSKQSAVIRKLTAVETLGCTEIICSDKTGTLTQNKMTVVERSSDNDKALVLALALCSDAKFDDEKQEAIGEPTECALVNDAHKEGILATAEEYVRIGEAPFDSNRKMMSVVCKDAEDQIIQFTKGAPDEILNRCATILKDGKEIPLTDELRDEVLANNKAMADQALRVLAAAHRRWDAAPADYSPAMLENDLCFIGLVGMIDPIRPEVKVAIEKCKSAGIRAIMITGDHKDTATAIARQLGILNEGQFAITGAELNEISEEQLAKDIYKYSVYARVQPEHKVRIVRAWKAQGKIVAMTGDGVNDAPSIKSADIGVGMGITGTDVTKNVADMVLADDNFATIVSAAEEGRRIYDNIRKAIQFLLSANLAEVLSIFFATLLGFTILKPVHLLWINLITDTFPALSLGTEPAEDDIMQRKPRATNEGIFAGGLGFDVGFQGVIITILTLASYFIGHFMESGRWEVAESADGMTMAFLTLSLVEIFHSFNMRSRRKSIFAMHTHNKLLWGSMVLSFVLTTVVIYVPFLADAFGFEVVSFAEYMIAILLALTVIPVMELVKFIQRKFSK